MNEAILKCPKCGGDIRETDKAYGCSNWKPEDGACRATVWKKIAGRDISVEEAKQLFEDGETADYLDDFISKTGKSFSAKLKFVEDYTKTEMEFKPKA